MSEWIRRMFGAGPVQNPFGVPCDACRARDAHIDDLRRLLDDERAQRNRVFGAMFPQVAGNIAGAVSEDPGIINRRAPSLAEARRAAVERESKQGGSKQYWEKRKEHYQEIEKDLHERIANVVQHKAGNGKEDPSNPQPAQESVPAGSEFVEQVVNSERDEDRQVLE